MHAPYRESSPIRETKIVPDGLEGVEVDVYRCAGTQYGARRSRQGDV